MDPSTFRYLGSTPCTCGPCRRVTTERIHLHEELASRLHGELDGKAGLLLGDPRTLEACGLVLAEQLRQAGDRVETIDLEQELEGELHADDQAIDVAVETLNAHPEALPVAVGSGTVNDVVKAAAHQLGRPYVAVATAPSMNGYTSAIAAITREGLKGTWPSTPPVAVLADPEVLAHSPRRLQISGLADLLSKPVSSADWKMGHLLWDEPYCEVPAEMAGRAVERAVVVASRLPDEDPEASEVLFDALLLSGISMAVAGTSSPASGGEHLISHYLDMTAHCAPGGPRKPALHGEQVGVGTAISTRLYGALLSRGVDEIDWERAVDEAPSIDAVPEWLDQAEYLPGVLRQQFMHQSRKKLERLGSPAVRVARIRQRWDELRETLAPSLRDAERYGQVLPMVGAPANAGDLGVQPRELSLAYRLGRFVRDRYTVLDLAGDLGLILELEQQVLPG